MTSGAIPEPNPQDPVELTKQLDELRATRARLLEQNAELRNEVAESRLRLGAASREIQSELKLHEALFRIVEEASEAHDMQLVYATVHKIVGGLMDATNFYIALHEAATSTIHFPYFVDAHDPPPPPRQLGRGLTEYVLRTGAPALISSQAFDDLVRRGEVEPIGSATVDWLGAPLQARGETLGAVVVQSYTEGSRFGVRERDILTFVSRAIAFALERRRTEEELRQGEAKLRAIFSGINDVVLVLDREGRYLEIAPTSADLLYRPPAELLGKRLHDVFEPAQADLFLGAITRAFAERRRIDVDYALSIGGREVWFAGTATPMLDDRVVFVARDITERKRATDALRDSEARYRQLFQGNPHPMFVFDVQTLAFLEVNDAAVRQYGYSREEFLSLTTKDIRPPEDVPRYLDNLRRLAASNSHSASSRHRRKDGSLLDVEIFAHKIVFGGRPARLFSATDVTERRRAQESQARLQESVQRSETMAALGSLIAGVAHEVRNPLFSISSTLDAFEARFHAREEFGRYLEVLRHEVDRLGGLMAELLEYGRPVSGARTVESVTDVVQEAMRGCEALAGRQGVVMQGATQGEPPLVPMDRRQMVQVFQNLLQNAVQHSPRGSVVHVDIEARLVDGQPHVASVVRDSGRGIAIEDLPRIYEPFFTRRRGGTGLGLSIVQRVVEEHGGRVVAANDPRGGAAMTVTLPATQPPLEPPKSEPSAS